MRISIFCAVLCFTSALMASPTAAPRETAIGYLKVNAKGVIFFVHNPAANEIGIPLIFESKDENRRACKVTTVVPKGNCPPQSFSYINGEKDHKPAMLSTRLENANSQWHHLERTTHLLKK